MVGGPPRDPELTISSLICLNFMSSLSLPHSPVTCVGLCLWHFSNSNASHQTVDPILEKLDRYNLYLMYRLYRESTRFVDGKIVKVRFHALSSSTLPTFFHFAKDLSYLNRDLSKVIMLDTDPDHVSTHPENAVVLPKWKGDPKDKGLVAIIPFLECMQILFSAWV